MKKAQEWFDEYGTSHKNPINKLIHWICVPIIFFSIIGFFISIPAPEIVDKSSSLYPYFNYGTFIILLGMIFYWLISPAIAVGMLLFSVFVLWGNIQLAGSLKEPLWLISLILFVSAWIGQFIGHYIEGAKPSFFKDLQFLLIGPAWLMGFIYKAIGIRY